MILKDSAPSLSGYPQHTVRDGCLAQCFKKEEKVATVIFPPFKGTSSYTHWSELSHIASSGCLRKLKKYFIYSGQQVPAQNQGFWNEEEGNRHWATVNFCHQEVRSWLEIQDIPQSPNMNWSCSFCGMPSMCWKHVSLFSFFLFMYVCMYVWLLWVFLAARGLSLVEVSGGYSSLRSAGFSLQWLLLLRSMGSRHVGFSSCGTQAQ